MLMLIWSMLKQGVSLFGLVLLSAGFLLLVLADFMAYFSHSGQAPLQNIGRLHVPALARATLALRSSMSMGAARGAPVWTK